MKCCVGERDINLDVRFLPSHDESTFNISEFIRQCKEKESIQSIALRLQNSLENNLGASHTTVKIIEFAPEGKLCFVAAPLPKRR